MTVRPARDDRGASLVLVLVLVTVLSVGLGGLLTFADTSMRTTVALREQAADSYAADGALQVAVNAIRTSTYAGRAGEHCFGDSDSMSVPYGEDGTKTATVTCTPNPNRVKIGCPALSDCNRPGNAILTLGRVPGEDGVLVKDLKDGLRVHGTIVSHSGIRVSNGELIADADVYAAGTCTGRISSPEPPRCPYPDIESVGADPGYTPEATIADLPLRSLPPCTARGGVVEFEPGYYDDAAGLSAMMSRHSPCRDSIWWFKPVMNAAGAPIATGVFYFDFHNDSDHRNPLLPAVPNRWTVESGRLVGGTPLDSSGAVAGAPSLASPLPGSCNNPIDDDSAIGVQFVFGNDSRLVATSSQVEVCGTYHDDRPPVAITGLKSGEPVPVRFTGDDAVKLDSVVSAGKFVRATAANLRAADGSDFATWRSTRKNDTTTLAVQGFRPSTVPPPGSVLRSAAVVLTHRHADAATTDSFGVAVTPTGGQPVTASATGRAGSAAFGTTRVPIDTDRTGSLAKAVYAGTFGGARIDLTTTLPTAGDTEDLDAVALELTYEPPAFHQNANCATEMPYLGPANPAACAQLVTEYDPMNKFYVQGTTYLPRGVVDITLNNVTERVFRFGVVARALHVTLTGSATYEGPVIEVPDDAPGSAFSVNLRACLAQNPCPDDLTADLRARVEFIDPAPANPVAGKRQVQVLSWSRSR